MRWRVAGRDVTLGRTIRKGPLRRRHCAEGPLEEVALC